MQEKSKTPRISIIVPVYNTGVKALNMIKDVRGQNYEDYEMILVNDGSTDDSLVTLKDAAKGDGRLKVVTKENGGVSSARNAGLDVAKGELILFLDSDDRVTGKSMLADIANALTDPKLDVAVTGLYIVKKGVREKFLLPSYTGNVRKYTLQCLLAGKLYTVYTKMFRREIIEKHKLRFDEKLSFGEDLVFSLRYLRHCQKMVVVPEAYYIYYPSTSGTFAKMALDTKQRRTNVAELRRFAGGKNKFLVSMIELRWRVSYAKLWLKYKL